MKLNLKPQAIKLRKKGFAIADIARKLEISKSTASLWCRGVNLTPEQRAQQEARTGRKLERFFKMVEAQKKARVEIKNDLTKKSIKALGSLSTRDLFVAGVSLYWAEGFKHEAEKRLGFCNSDPVMINFQLEFWRRCLGVNKSDISPRLTLNEAFRDRTDKIQKFWSDCLDIPIEQFTKPFYQKVKSVKVYENIGGYHGVLRIHARKSSKLMTQMRGYILGIKSFVK